MGSTPALASKINKMKNNSIFPNIILNLGAATVTLGVVLYFLIYSMSLISTPTSNQRDIDEKEMQKYEREKDRINKSEINK